MGSGANNWLDFSGAGLHAPPHQRPGDEAAHAHARQEPPPKLEDFLGAQESTTTARPFGATTTIGLSMIKNWLRSQPAPAPAGATEEQGDRTVTSGGAAAVVEAAPHKKAAVAAETFGQRTSVYRGVTKHRWTGRYEAHLWDNSCKREGQTRKGRQVYLGGYDKEEKAARAYDLAALKYWGTTTTTNFPVSEYGKELEEMKHMSRQEYVASLRRKSSGFSRGASIYRGVTRHHQHGRWQARIGRVAGNKDLYLGTFSTQEEAAEAYDIAAIKFRGLNAVTNFDMSRYDVQSIIESRIPVGGSGAAKRIKGDVPAELSDIGGTSNLLTDGIGSYYGGMQHDTATYGGGWAPLTFLPPALPLQYSDGHGSDPTRTRWCKQEEELADGAVVAAAHSLHNLQRFPAAVGSTHNFFQPSSVHHGVMGFCETQHPHQSLDYSSLVMYGGAGNGYHHAAEVMSHGGVCYDMPVAKLTEHAASSNEEDDGGTVVSDLYNGRPNLYYLSQDSPPLGDASKENTCGQGVEYEHWVSSESSDMARKATDLMVGHGLPLYQGNGT